MKQKHTFFVTIGIPSLFLIFSVLCLCVLALLTLSSSRTSLTTARHSMEQTEKYYSACSEATERVADIRSTLAGYLASAEDKAEYFSQVKTLQIRNRILSGIPLITPCLFPRNLPTVSSFR